MDAALPSNPRRAGALWVAGTGAFLLLAAAAVFIAVSWHDLPDGLKLAIIVALTGGFLLGGRAVERSLPATGSVVFHLGAFLLPIDVAAVAVRVDVGWRGLLLAEGVLGMLAWPLLARVSPSVVLRRAGMLAVPVFCAGLAAVTAAPAPLVLAAIATAALVIDRRDEALVWSVIAGLAPIAGLAVAALVAEMGMPGDGVLRELGLAGDVAGVLAIAAGLLSALVLAVEARRRAEIGLGFIGMVAITTSSATTWRAAEISERSTILALPALFLLIEIALLLADRDLFWRRTVRPVGVGVEVVAGLATVAVSGVLLLIAPFIEQGFFSSEPLLKPDPTAGMSLAVLALGWLASGVRWSTMSQPYLTTWERVARSVDHIAAAPLAALSAVVAVEIATASTVGTTAAMIAIAGCLSLSSRAPARALVFPMVLWAPVVSGGEPAVALLAGVIGGLIAANAARTQAVHGATVAGEVALSIAGAAAATIGALLAAEQLGLVPAMAVATGAVWGVGLLSDRASVAAGHGARAMLLVPATISAFAPDLASGIDEAGGRSIPVLLAAAVLLADAFRLDRPGIGHGAVAAVLTGTILAGFDAGLSPDQTGLALCAVAVVAAGLAALVAERWRPALISAAAGGIGAGTILAATEPTSLMTALIAVGGLLVAVGIVEEQPTIVHIGATIATGGVIGHLVLADVQASEAYLAPVCAQLIAAGWHVRSQRPLSSWTAYAPAIGLFGLAAVVERAGGGGTGHALAAAAVGVVAVAIGGWKRLAGPLFTGTALLVAITAVDVLASLGEVPAWIWLAVAGSALLGVGIALERTDTSPADAGRRVVEVITERFD